MPRLALPFLPALLAAATCLTAAPAQPATLTPQAASRFASLVLSCASKEYPNKLDHVMSSAAEVQSPKALHPSFYGCFDWHSSVHGHWVAVRLLRSFPNLPEAPALRALLDDHLSAEKLAAELFYFREPGHKSFERTYGWAWLLKLAAELHAWDTEDARRWSRNLQPLASQVAANLLDFLPRQTYPIRTGVHPNTAFTLSLALDYARAAKDTTLEAMIAERARRYYLHDKKAPLAWEPGGEDFLSASLEEAALMRKILPAAAFRPWLAAFLPTLLAGKPLSPAIVSDRTDPKIVHLDGLNLNRARCLFTLAGSLPARDPRRASLLLGAETHAEASLPHIASGSYEGEHWLGTFALFLLETRQETLGH